MSMKLENTLNTPVTALLDPTAVLDAMIELRFQMAALEQQMQALQPAFLPLVSHSTPTKLRSNVPRSLGD